MGETWNEQKKLIVDIWKVGSTEWKKSVLDYAFQIGNILWSLPNETIVKLCPEVSPYMFNKLVEEPETINGYIERIVNSSTASDVSFLQGLNKINSLSTLRVYIRGWLIHFDGTIEGRSDGPHRDDMINGIPTYYIIIRSQFLTDLVISIFKFLKTVRTPTELKPMATNMIKKAKKRNRNQNKAWTPSEKDVLRMHMTEDIFINLPQAHHMEEFVNNSAEITKQFTDLYDSFKSMFNKKWTNWSPEAREQVFMYTFRKIKNIDFSIFDGNFSTIFDILIPEINLIKITKESDYLLELISKFIDEKYSKNRPKYNQNLYDMLTEKIKNAKWPSEAGKVDEKFGKFCPVGVLPYLRQIITGRILWELVRSCPDFNGDGHYDENFELNLAQRDVEALQKHL